MYQSHHISPNIREHGGSYVEAKASEYQVSLKLTDKYAAKFGMEGDEMTQEPGSLNIQKYGSGMRNQMGEEEIPTRDKVNQIANKYGSQMQENKISLGAYQRAQQPNYGNSPTSD